MGAVLNLVRNDIHRNEKRTFPRFPYCFLTFKANKESHVFEVKDISHSGMQLAFRDGEHHYQNDNQIKGKMHWQGREVELEGEIKWSTPERIGVKFSESFLDDVKSFLSIDNIVKSLRPLHQSGLDLEVPRSLKYWLRGDGPNEIFVWCHPDGEFSRFHFIIMQNFIEWEDGKGVQTGKALTKRDLDTPLITEDEFVFEMDDYIDEEKTNLALKLLNTLPEQLLSSETIDFIRLKLE